MNTQNITISDKQFPIVTYKDKPVVTLKMIDQMHSRKDTTASNVFKNNRARFQEGKDFYLVDYKQKGLLAPFGINVSNRGLLLFTELGYLKITKTMRDALSWEVFDKLIECYFRAKDLIQNKDIVPALEYQPLSVEHQHQLKAAISERRKVTPVSSHKLFSELRKTFGVRSWKAIDDTKFTDAMVLVKTVVLEGEYLPKQDQETYTLTKEQLMKFYKKQKSLINRIEFAYTDSMETTTDFISEITGKKSGSQMTVC